ncbi:MAG: aspartate/glutamate racemase family protein [Clostridia bacterium]|nr:aspartate/glutamate racemase family protein [Clostridia bacterium]
MQFAKNPAAKVCFFDSGIGGLNLFYNCSQKLRGADLYYYADNFNVPYGNLSASEITAKADKIFFEISKQNPSAAVVACNTVTATCAGYLRAKYDFPIIGIQPAVKPAAAAGSCTVLATAATANSAALKELVVRFGNGRTEVIGCPQLAAYIENNIFNIEESKVAAILPQEVKTDGVVLGCTHYAFIKEIIAKKYGCPVYDGIDGTAARLCRILGISDHPPAKTLPPPAKVTFTGGDEAKNAEIFRLLGVAHGGAG